MDIKKEHPLFEDYVNSLVVERGLSMNTCEAYQRDLTRYLNYLKRVGATATGASPGDIASYLSELKRRGLSVRSYTRSLIAIRGFYRYLLNKGRVKSSPCSSIDLPRTEKNLPKVLTLKEVDRLLDNPGADTPRGRGTGQCLKSSMRQGSG